MLPLLPGVHQPIETLQLVLVQLPAGQVIRRRRKPPLRRCTGISYGSLLPRVLVLSPWVI